MTRFTEKCNFMAYLRIKLLKAGKMEIKKG